MRTYRHHPGPCESCGRAPDNGALWVTDAAPLDIEVRIIEANPGEPKLCDECELDRRTNHPAPLEAKS